MSFQLSNLNPVKRMERRIIQQRDEQKKRTGVSIQSVPQISKNHKVLFVLGNALINFLVVTGMFGCFVDTFEVPCNFYMVLAFNAIISIYIGFLYYNKWIKIIGYVVGIGGFFYGIFRYAWVIRSGFSTIANIVMEYLEKDMDLPIERRYSTYNMNPKVTTTMCLIFLSFGIMLLLNMVIAESRGIIFVFCATFLITQTGMYFDEPVDITYFSMYMSGIIALYFLRSSTHYHMETSRRKGYRYKKNNRKNIVHYDYTSDGLNSFWIMSVLIVMVMATAMIFTRIVPEKGFQMEGSFTKIKDDTRDFTRQVALVGFTGMFRSSSPGGVSNNKLGQVPKIEFDYQTDLIVKTGKLSPEDTMYIRCFYGSVYGDSIWLTLRESDEMENRQYTTWEQSPNPEDYGLHLSLNTKMTSRLLALYGMDEDERLVEVTNVLAGKSNVFLPYNICDAGELLKDSEQDDVFDGALKTGWKFSTYYIPLNKNGTIESLQTEITQLKNKQNPENALMIEEGKYAKYVHDAYLQVPEKNIAAIEHFLQMYGIDKNSETLVEDVVRAFQNNFEYTFMPGRLPGDKDFVNYFLEDTKQGYCTYFATAATLIYRYLGIPARYVGGYQLSGDTVEDGTKIKDIEPDEWFEHVTDSMEVYSYELADNTAHAWTEIYIDGLGWQPVEVTPAIVVEEEPEEEKNDGGIGNYLATTVFTPGNINRAKDTSLFMLLLVAVGFFVIVIGYEIVGVVVRQKRRNEKNITRRFDTLKKAMVIGNIVDSDNLSCEVYEKCVIEQGLLECRQTYEFFALVEKAKFSGKNLSEEQTGQVLQTAAKLQDEIYRRNPLLKRLWYRYIKNY